MKARVVSLVLRRVFVILALTKKQANPLNSLFKAVLLFVDNEAISGRIHASYLSCRRESERLARRAEGKADELFSSCNAFSFGV